MNGTDNLELAGSSRWQFFGVWLARQLKLPPLFVVNVNGEVFPAVWSWQSATLGR